MGVMLQSLEACGGIHPYGDVVRQADGAGEGDDGVLQVLGLL